MGKKTPCAIVPLKPNELSRPEHGPSIARIVSSTGIVNPHIESKVDKRWPFNLRKR